MKKLLIGLLLGLAVSGMSQIVNYQAGPGMRGLSIDKGMVHLGYFSERFDPRNLKRLADCFTVVHQTDIRSIFGQPGRFAADVNLSGYEGIRMWWLVTGEDGSYALFGSPQWIPADTGPLSISYWTSDQATWVIHGKIVEDQLIVDSAK